LVHLCCWFAHRASARLEDYQHLIAGVFNLCPLPTHGGVANAASGKWPMALRVVRVGWADARTIRDLMADLIILMATRDLGYSRFSSFFGILNPSPQCPSTRHAHHGALPLVNNGTYNIQLQQTGLGVLPM
jgi:hypothetical protein